MPRFEWTNKHTTILIYTCVTILLAIAIFFAVLFPGAVATAFSALTSTLSPVFYGFAIAYLFYPICLFFENGIFARLVKKNERAAHLISVACTFIVAALVIAVFVWILVPQVVNSYLTLQSKFEGYIQKAENFINEAVRMLRENDEFGLLPSFIGSGNLADSLSETLSSMFGFVGNIADTVIKYSSKILTTFAKVVVSIIFAAYFLIEKKHFFSWISKISSVILTRGTVNAINNWLEYTNNVFSRFISGKLINALIITVVNFIVFGLCDIPYYPIIALITGITDLIPYFGPFIGAVPCAFIILIADPIKLIWFLVLVLVIQQIDANVIGPKILGEKVGVDSLLIIVAITVGGGLFGILGMFISVPVFTVIAHAINSFINMRLRKKGLPTYSSAYEKSSGEEV